MDPVSDELLKLLRDSDPEIASALADEARRQADTIELIASENHVSPAVMHTMGSWNDQQVRGRVSRQTLLQRLRESRSR